MVFFSLLFFCFAIYPLFSQSKESKADSIINNLLNYRKLYANYFESYDAEIYIKGNSQVKKKNLLLRFSPGELYLDKKGKDHFVESFIDIHFESPDHFTQQIKAINGTRFDINNMEERVGQFLNVNIYNPVLFKNQLLLPGIKDVRKYYRFEYVSLTDTLNLRIHKIKIIPIIRSQKLISGYFNIVDGSWTVFNFNITGKSEFYNFRIETEYGTSDTDFLLPSKTILTFYTKLLGNEAVDYYHSFFKYTSLVKRQIKTKEEDPNYDLSIHFNTQLDSIPIIKDTLFWGKNRPIPLTEKEKTIYKSALQKQKESDSLSLVAPQMWNFSWGMISPQRFYYKDTQFKYSGFFNPFKLAYSKTNGLSYSQKFQLIRKLRNDDEIHFTPNIGYFFKDNEIYFNTPIRWIFYPQKMGEVYFSLENRNQSYNLSTIDEINSVMPDSVNFNDFNLKYYKHLHLELETKYEIANGLLIHGGIEYSWYDMVEPESSKRKSGEKLRADVAEKIDDFVKYRAFAPTIGIIWTPGQYYRMNGKKKEYVFSNYPTFSLEYRKGIKSPAFNSNSNYDRIETDIQQKIPFSLLNSFQYYIGAGIFTNTKSTYFADFDKFQKHNFPQSWNDPIGGVFHLLEGDWYNASRSYIQGHFMYESPFAFLKLFRGVTKDILNERFYLSQLYTPALPCYTEIGYGLGNFILNAGIFISLDNGKYQSFGLKAVFEL